MRIVIIGGGKIGYFLTRNMLDRNNEVKLIEKNKARCMWLANQLDAEVICGDGTEIEVLASAGIGRADCFIAVTGRDQDNLVASQLAKKKFMVKQVIARANNPRNVESLKKLGVENAVSSTEIITQMIEREVASAGLHLLTMLNKGQAAICSITLPKRTRFNGMPLRDIQMPKSSLIVSLLRDEQLIIPQGDTRIYAGDEVIAICNSENQQELMSTFRE